MQLTCKYSKPNGSAEDYLVIPTSPFTEGGPWSAIFLRDASPCPANLQELFLILYHKDIIKGVGTQWQKCWFVFFGEGWNEKADFNSIGGAIDHQITTLNDNTVNGRMIWYKSSEDLSGGNPVVVADIPIMQVTTKIPDGSQVPITILSNRNFFPFFPNISSGSISGAPFIYKKPVEGYAGNLVLFNTLALSKWDRIYFSGGYGTASFPIDVSLINESNNKQTSLVTLSGFWTDFCQLFFAGNAAGQIIVNGKAGEGIASLCPEFIYSIQAPASVTEFKSSRFKYPIFEPTDWKNWIKGGAVSCRFSPARPCDPNLSFISINTNSEAIQSTFRTTLGKPVFLKPVDNNSVFLVFNKTSNGQVYLTPHGSFEMSVKGKQGKEPLSLVCGLSGTESINFNNGDIMKFVGGQPAEVSVVINTDLPKPGNATFSLLNESSCTTSRVWISPGNPDGTSSRQYFSEPESAPFFKSAQSGPPLDLKYMPMSQVELSDQVNSDFPGIPMVPYQGVTQSTDENDFGHYAEYMEAFEFQVLAPERFKIIGEMDSSHSTSLENGTVYALTPQGYQATFFNGSWNEINVAQKNITGIDPKSQKEVVVSNVDINFSNSNQSTPLPDPLQKAFLTNQQFLVMTANVGGNLDVLKASIKMSDWSFGSASGTKGIPLLDMPTSTTPGDYTNVLLFKSGGITINQMARHPHLWTQYEAFNDTQSDPQGHFLSNWLVEYLERAELSYDQGKGATSLANFCNLINAPNWNGFLALKVKVGDIATLPVDVQALVADISGDLYAHHLGNEVNHVKPSATVQGASDISSPFFGLIHYFNPQFAAEIQHLPAYIQGAADYDFNVLTLEVVFEKALETHFSNKCMLTMNTFFGDKVARSGPNGQSGANNIILIGTYHDVDNVPSYSFSTGGGVTTDFYLDSNAFNCNRISNVTMNVVKLSGTSETTDVYKASFAIRGSFDFLNDVDFDLLSYEYLPYFGLTMDVTIQHGKPNIYEMDTSKLQFEKNQTEALPAGSGQQYGQALNVVRTGSLVAQFPMKLKGLVQCVGSRDNPNNASPADQGFRLLEASLVDFDGTKTTEHGISFTSPADGVGWYALEFDVVLGGKGSLASSGAITASIMLAWTPGGKGVASASPQFKLSGPDGVSLSFDFEGVLKFGSKGLMLSRYKDSSDPGKDYFYLVFQSIGLSMLGVSFPPGGTTNLVLMGDSQAAAGTPLKPTLSWLGGYAKKETKTKGK